MSTSKKNQIKTIKTINIDKKLSSNLGNFTTGTDESMIIKTNNNNYNRSSILNIIQNNNLNLFKSKHRIRSANQNNKLNQSSKSTFTIEKKIINKYNNYFNYNSLLNNDNKENKQNQVNFMFNNSLLNNCYNNKLTKVNNYFLKLNKIYNPHHNYFRIVKNEKKIIKELMSQTKNNFNNNYKIYYYNSDSKKRNYILKCFNAIKRNKAKSIDSKNSIESIAIKELNKNNNILNVRNNKINIKKHIIFPSSINIKTFICKRGKLKLKTMKIIDEISQKNIKIISTKNKERMIKSALYKNNNFFKTLPKNRNNNNNNNNDNDIYFDYSKTSFIE